MNYSLPVIRAIDAHVHVHPDEAALLLDIMEANHLSGVVNVGILEVLGIPFQDGMRAFRKTLGDRMVYFPTPDFSDTAPGFGERMAEDLERKVEAGARGLKIFKELGLRHKDADGHLIPVDDPRLDPLWAKAGELGVPVLIHTADPLAFFQPLDENNERWEELHLHPDWYFGGPEFPDHDTLLAQRNRVLERHPNTIFIGAHLGEYPENLAYVDACLDRYPNFYVDTSARIGEIGRHPTKEVRAFFIKHQNRVLFGSDLVIGWEVFEDRTQRDIAEFKRFYDAHWRFFETHEQQVEYPGYPVQGRWKVDAINLPDVVLEKLYLRNAQRLIPGL
ncbi:MAG: amidohydrolase family protein [Anaerolineae bacterium]|jgi:predicted TIM-barrel fold metal-dependent hydrolase|nr:amidohydrolase family protein [Anaerolineae bacterium]